MGGQNARISKRSAAGRVGWSNPDGGLWRLRVRAVWVARMQGFPSILRREVCRQEDVQSGRCSSRKTCRQENMQTRRHAIRKTCKQADMQAGRYAGRQADKQEDDEGEVVGRGWDAGVGEDVC